MNNKMQIEFDLKKRNIFVIVGVFLVLASLIFVNSEINPGHSAEKVNVDIDGEVMSLQEAYDAGLLGSKSNVDDWLFAQGVLTVGLGEDENNLTVDVVNSETGEPMEIEFAYAASCTNNVARGFRVEIDQPEFVEGDSSFKINLNNQGASHEFRICWFAQGMKNQTSPNNNI